MQPPRPSPIAIAASFILFLLSAVRVDAQQTPPSPVPVPSTPAAVVKHDLRLAGRTSHYTSTAERTVLRDAAGHPTAAMFSVSYTLDAAAASPRPVAFLWNGGPGSSTLWLQMGSFSPVRVPLNDTGVVVPPGALVPNADTLLPVTDLVFVDAPGTGYSRIVGSGKTTDFYGVDQDARAFTQFIERWLSDHHRWNSPKYLIGESYGTTRAAIVVNLLQNDGVGVNGVVLIGAVLDVAFGNTLSDVRGCAAILPTEAAAAWYHKALPDMAAHPALEPFLSEVRAFAEGPYLSAMIQGSALGPAARRSIAEQLHQYLGVGSPFIERENLCVFDEHFRKELERDRGLVLGRYDARFVGYDTDRNNGSQNYDPTESTIAGAFVSQFNGYLRDTLRFIDPDRYLVDGDAVFSSWNWQRGKSDVPDAGVLPDTLPDLQSALIRNPALHVFVACGEYDMATPFTAVEMELRQLDLSPELRSHIQFGYYPAGHMIYLENGSRRKLNADITGFVRATAPTGNETP